MNRHDFTDIRRDKKETFIPENIQIFPIQKGECFYLVTASYFSRPMSYKWQVPGQSKYDKNNILMNLTHINFVNILLERILNIFIFNPSEERQCQWRCKAIAISEGSAKHLPEIVTQPLTAC